MYVAWLVSSNEIWKEVWKTKDGPLFNFASTLKAELSAVSDSAAVTMAITRPLYSIVRIYGHSLLERLTKCFMFTSASYARIDDRANETSDALNETTYAHPLDRDKKEGFCR